MLRVSNPTPPSAHRNFLELVEAFYRYVGSELPYYESHPDKAIAFEAEVDDVKFSVGYDPSAHHQAKLFVYCALGPVPLYHEGTVLRRLLELNLTQAREHSGTYCIDGGTQQIVYYLHAGEVEAPALHAQLVRVAQLAKGWRQDHCLSDSSDAETRAARTLPLSVNRA